MENDQTSLSHYLAMAGTASRRKSTEIIREGRVQVNSQIVASPGFKVGENDIVAVDGIRVRIKKRSYIMLNKPRGYTCTNEDRFAEKKAVDLIELPGKRLFSIGRLDRESEGLILFTDDGDYAAVLTHPRHRIRKTYIVKTDKELTTAALKKFKSGIHDMGELLKAEDVIPVSAHSYKFILAEGRKREIRRMLASEKIKTVRLKRIAIGKLSLGELKPGQWRHLTPEEINLSRKS